MCRGHPDSCIRWRDAAGAVWLGVSVPAAGSQSCRKSCHGAWSARGRGRVGEGGSGSPGRRRGRQGSHLGDIPGGLPRRRKLNALQPARASRGPAFGEFPILLFRALSPSCCPSSLPFGSENNLFTMSWFSCLGLPWAGEGDSLQAWSLRKWELFFLNFPMKNMVEFQNQEAHM